MDDSSYLPFFAVGVSLIVAALGGYYYSSTMGGISTKPAGKSTNLSTNTLKKEQKAKPKYINGPLSIFFGSQTGTAEGFARTLLEEGRAAGFDTKVCDLEEFDPETLAKTPLAIFLMSTYGEGEPTDNAQKFVKWLKNEDQEKGSDFLQAMKFVVFGLGNKQYEHFNRTGKVTDKCLLALGGIPVYKYGEGDDDGSLEEDFDQWKSGLWTALGGSTSSASSAESQDLSLTFTVKVIGNINDNNNKKMNELRDAKTTTKQSQYHEASEKMVSSSLKHFFTSPRVDILRNVELRNQSYRNNVSNNNKEEDIGSTHHIELNLKGSQLSYVTADNLAILPENPAEVVEKFAAKLKYNLQEVISFEAIEGKESEFKAFYPTPCTVREILSCYLDILGAVKHSTMKSLVRYVQNEQQKQWLLKLLAPEQRHDFKKLMEEEYKTIYSLLLNELSSCNIPLVDMLHLVPAIQPRYYTISSSSKCYPDNVHITVSVTEMVNKTTGVKSFGLCSQFLANLRPRQDTCRVYVRASSFRLPKQVSSPIILVGPGTGIAPMRAFLQEREYLIQKSQRKNIGDCTLFFGCKHESMDYIYRNEIQDWLASPSPKVLTNLHTAFSRDTNRKVYVQHLMTENREIGLKIVETMLVEEGSFYVCGATAMGTDVMNAIVSLLSQHKGDSVEAATAVVKKWQEQGRYIQELWTA